MSRFWAEFNHRALDAAPPLSPFEEHLIELMDAIDGDVDLEPEIDLAVDDLRIDDCELDADAAPSLNDGGAACVLEVAAATLEAGVKGGTE